MQTITLKVGSAGTGRDYPTIAAAWAAIPADLVAADVAYILELYNDSEFVPTAALNLTGKTTDSSHTITIRAAAGQSYTSNPNVNTNALRYNIANGVAIRCGFNYSQQIAINQDWLTLEGIQLKASGNGGVTGIALSNGPNSVVKNCLIELATSNPAARGLSFFKGGKAFNPVIILTGANSQGVYYSTSTARIENATIVRLSSLASYGNAFDGDIGGLQVVNCVAFGFTTFSTHSDFVGSNNATDLGTIQFGTQNKTSLVYANQFVDTVNDFRVKAGADLIDAGTAPSTANTVTVNGTRQQGTSADIGAWEFTSATQAPSATITAITVTGATVTISGTTTGTPTSGLASIAPTAVTGNNAVAQGPTAVSLGSGTFTVQFTGVRVGRYSPTITVSNTAFPNVAAANNVGSFDIVSAQATSVVQDAMDGQVLTIHGTTSGTPTSGSLTVPAAATNPNGAAQQVVAVTLGSGTFTVSATLAPGNYDAPILTFTNADGTSLPQAGTAAVTVMGISGNPDAPPVDGSGPVATVTSVAVSPSTATGSTTFTATVTGTNSPSQAVNWTTTAGSVTGGVFTAPAATSSVQVITVTATSTIDASKSGTATVTIAAVSATPTVSSVAVTPATTVLATNTTVQFAAQVFGTNSPSQAVTWSKSGAGTLDTAGLFTRPAQTSSIQVITITATSVADSSKSGSATVTVLALPITNERLDMAKLDATQFINLMPLGQSGKRSLTTLIDALIGDIKQLRDAQTVMAAKLDADAGVTDSNYSAVATVPEANVILGK